MFNFMSSLISSFLNYNSVRETNQANKELAQANMLWQQQENERTHARNLQLWNMENEYNSPQQQMQRLNAAGLSPMLAYSGGNVGGLSSSSAPRRDAATAITPNLQPYQGFNLQAPNIGQMINALKQSRLFNEEVRGKKLQNDLLENEISHKKAITAGQVWQNLFNQNTTEYQQQKLQYGANLMKATYNLRNAETNLKRQQYEIQDETRQYQIASARLGVEQQELRLLQSQLDYQFGKDTFDVRKMSLALDNTLKSSTISLNNEQRKLVKRNTTKVLHEIAGLIETNNYRKFEHNMQYIIGAPKAGDKISSLVQQFLFSLYNSVNYIGSLF